MSATSGQFLTVPPLNHRSSQLRRRDSARVGAQPPRAHDPTTSRVASSSRVRLEDTPLGIPGPAAAAPSSPLKVDNDTDTTTTTSTATATTSTTTTTTVRTSSSSSSSSSPPASPLTPPAQQQMQQTPPTPPTPLPSSLPTGPTAAAATTATAVGVRSQSPPLSPRSIFRAVSFLLRLRSPPSADALCMTYTSGARRTHAVLSKSRAVKKAAQPLTYSRTLVCADAVNAEVLLRLARNELLDRAQQASRHFTALVDEEWRYSIRQTKSGDYTVEVFYSACPAQCGGDPRKPIALSHVTNLPGLMRVVHSE